MPATSFILVLSEVGDPVAGAAYELLRRRGEPAELVVGEQLALARRWVHEVGSGGARTTVELQDGRVLCDTAIRAVLNRLRGTNVPQFARAKLVDRTYAASEMHALLTSWLSSLRCPMANPACARGLSGALRSPVEWAHLAARTGLPVRRQVLASRAGAVADRTLVPHQFMFADMGTSVAKAWGSRALVGDEPVLYLERTDGRARWVFVIGDKVIGAPSADWQEPCRKLARDAGLVLLGISAAQREDALDQWIVTEVNPYPMTLGPRVVAEIADWISRPTESS